MRFKSIHNGRDYWIEEDLPEVGSYLYFYEGGKSMADILQDNVAACMQFALEEYGVPIESWRENP